MECDTDTIQTVDKYIYSRTLLKTAESMLPSSRLGLTVQQWIQKGVLKKRLENILNGKKSRKRRFITFGFFLMLMLSVGVFVFVSLLDDKTLEANLIKKVKTEYETNLRARGGIEMDDIPDHLISVLIFQEDSGFYDHEGVSVKAIFRAMINNLSGGPLQGASTITQQLSRVLVIKNTERTLSRKLKQIKAARAMEKHFSKKEILEMYLNSVYFGQGTYGVEMASQKYFRHPASGLALHESAMLVQSIGRPKVYNDIANPELAEKRTAGLLNRMAQRYLVDKQTLKQSLFQLKNRSRTNG